MVLKSCKIAPGWPHAITVAASYRTRLLALSHRMRQDPWPWFPWAGLLFSEARCINPWGAGKGFASFFPTWHKPPPTRGHPHLSPIPGISEEVPLLFTIDLFLSKI